MLGISYILSSFLQRGGLVMGTRIGSLSAVERARFTENIPEPEDHPVDKRRFSDAPNCFASRNLHVYLFLEIKPNFKSAELAKHPDSFH